MQGLWLSDPLTFRLPLRAAATEIRKSLNVNLGYRYLLTHRQSIAPLNPVLEFIWSLALEFSL